MFRLLYNLLDLSQANLSKMAKHWDSYLSHCTRMPRSRHSSNVTFCWCSFPAEWWHWGPSSRWSVNCACKKGVTIHLARIKHGRWVVWFPWCRIPSLSKPSSISVANIQTTAIHMPHWFPGASFMHESQEWLPYITVVILYSVCCPGMPVCHYFLGDRTAKSSVAASMIM